MTKLELFEPAMCCSTGVCGPSVDENLLMVSAVCDTLAQTNTFEVTRHNLTSDPDAFVKNEKVLSVMKEQGNDILPLTMIDGEIVKTGDYPTLDEFGNFLGVRFVTQNSESAGGCCGGESSGCC